MWGTVLVMAIVAAADPLRVGVVAYMLSRVHAMRLLVPFFLVGFTINVAVGAAVVFGFRNTALGDGRAASPILEIGIGVAAVTALLGLTNGFPTPYYLAAMAAALTSGAAVGQQMAALVVFNVIAFAVALIPLISFWIAPDATRVRVEQLYTTMKAHQRVVVTLIAGAVGVFFIGLGISHL